MNKHLIKVPNNCFYDNSIITRYKCPIGKVFLGLENPFLFIDVNEKAQKWDETSCYNEAEIAAMKKFLDFWLKKTAASETSKFKPEDIAFITPYAA